MEKEKEPVAVETAPVAVVEGGPQGESEGLTKAEAGREESLTVKPRSKVECGPWMRWRRKSGVNRAPEQTPSVNRLAKQPCALPV